MLEKYLTSWLVCRCTTYLTETHQYPAIPLFSHFYCRKGKTFATPDFRAFQTAHFRTPYYHPVLFSDSSSDHCHSVSDQRHHHSKLVEPPAKLLTSCPHFTSATLISPCQQVAERRAWPTGPGASPHPSESALNLNLTLPVTAVWAGACGAIATV